MNNLDEIRIKLSKGITPQNFKYMVTKGFVTFEQGEFINNKKTIGEIIFN